MIDIHTHLDFKRFDNDRDEVIMRFFDSKGIAMVNIGVDKKTISSSIQLAKNNKQIYCAIGFHPHDSDEGLANISQKEMDWLEQQAKQEEKVVAIGEIGLDYSKFNLEEQKQKQKELFEMQIVIANRLELPVIIHCRDAYEDVLEIISKTKYQKTKFVLHCFSADVEMTKKFVSLKNTLFSFAGNITFSKGNEHLVEVLDLILLEKILTETDCPFLAPVPMRGKRNEPLFAKYVIEKIAELKNLSFDKVERETEINAKNLFNLS